MPAAQRWQACEPARRDARPAQAGTSNSLFPACPRSSHSWSCLCHHSDIANSTASALHFRPALPTLLLPVKWLIVNSCSVVRLQSIAVCPRPPASPWSNICSHHLSWITGKQPAEQHVQLSEGQALILQSGKLAHLAGGSCLAIQGGSQILAAAVCEPAPFDRLPRPNLTNPFRVSSTAICFPSHIFSTSFSYLLAWHSPSLPGLKYNHGPQVCRWLCLPDACTVILL